VKVELFRNVDIYMQVNMTLQPRRPALTRSYAFAIRLGLRDLFYLLIFFLHFVTVSVFLAILIKLYLINFTYYISTEPG
jgi:hypothetical protein